MDTRQRQRTPRTAHTTLRPYPVADMTFNTGGAFCHVATAQGKGRFTARLPPGSNAIPEESNVDKTFVCKPPPRAQPPRPTPRARLPACRQHTHTCLHGLRLLSLATRVSACAADVRNPDGKGTPLLVTHHSSEKVTREVEDGPVHRQVLNGSPQRMGGGADAAAREDALAGLAEQLDALGQSINIL